MRLHCEKRGRPLFGERNLCLGEACAAAMTTPNAPTAREKRELLCEVCDREYRVWFAPNPLWNAVVRRSGDDEWEFLCPTCFTNIAAERGVEGTAFEVRLEQHDEIDVDERNTGAIGMAQQLLGDDGLGVMGSGPCADAQAEWRRMRAALFAARREVRALRDALTAIADLRPYRDPAYPHITINELPSIARAALAATQEGK